MNTVTPGSVNPVAVTVAQALTAWASETAPESGSAATVPTGITPEIVAVIEAAATAFLGTSIRIVSVRMSPEPAQDAGSWAERGRDIVHGSHNLVQRGR